MALAGECDDALPTSMSDFPQRLEWTNRSARAEFFGKFASSDALRSIIGIDFTLWNLLGAIILVAPEWTAGMNEQNLVSASPLAVGEDARAQGRSTGSLFHRSHIAPTCRAIESGRAVVPPYRTALAERLLNLVHGPMHRYFGLAVGRLPGARTARRAAIRLPTR